MKLILKYIKPYRGFLALTFIIKAFGTIVELIIPYILSHIVDVIVPKQVIGEIVFWGIMMMLCAALALICNVVANRRAAKTALPCLFAKRSPMMQ